MSDYKGARTVVGAIALTAAAAAALTIWAASVAFGSESTGIAANQRPWVVLILALAQFGLGCLFLLLLVVWVFGTAHIPAWARTAWWGRQEIPPAAQVPQAGRWSAGRVALGVVVAGAPFVVLGAPLLGIMIGWLLSPDAVLTAAERWIVVTVLSGQFVWGIYLLVVQRRRGR